MAGPVSWWWVNWVFTAADSPQVPASPRAMAAPRIAVRSRSSPLALMIRVPGGAVAFLSRMLVLWIMTGVARQVWSYSSRNQFMEWASCETALRQMRSAVAPLLHSITR